MSNSVQTPIVIENRQQIRKGLKQAGLNIHMLYPEKIVFAGNVPKRNAHAMCKKLVERFIDSNCLVALIGFSQFTKIITKTSDNAIINILDTESKQLRYINNPLYWNLIDVFDTYGIKLLLLECPIFTDRYNLCSVDSDKKILQMFDEFVRALQIGMKLTRLYDYRLKYSNGSLAFLNPEQIVCIASTPPSQSIVLLATMFARYKKTVQFKTELVEYRIIPNRETNAILET
jgi:hypothetical protein